MAKQPLICAYYYGNWKKDEYAGYRYQLYLHDTNLLNDLHDFILDEFDIPKHYQIKYWQGLQKTKNISFNSQGLSDLIEYLSDQQLEPEITRQLIAFHKQIQKQEILLDTKRLLHDHYQLELWINGLATFGAIWAWPLAMYLFKYHSISFLHPNLGNSIMSLIGVLFLVIAIASIGILGFEAIKLTFKMLQQIHESYLIRWLRSFQQLRNYELDGQKIVSKRQVH